MPYQLGDTPIRNFDNSLVFATNPILLYFLVSCFLFLVACCLLPTNLASVPGLLTCPCYSLIRRPCSLQCPLPYYPKYYLTRSPKFCKPALFYLDRLLPPRGSISLNNFSRAQRFSQLVLQTRNPPSLYYEPLPLPRHPFEQFAPWCFVRKLQKHRTP